MPFIIMIIISTYVCIFRSVHFTEYHFGLSSLPYATRFQVLQNEQHCTNSACIVCAEESSVDSGTIIIIIFLSTFFLVFRTFLSQPLNDALLC